MKKKITAPVLENKKIADGIYDMTLDVPEIAEQAGAGQFVSLFCGDRSRLLPRPISLCGIDAEKGTIRLVYRVTGKQTGTAQIAERKAGDTIEVMGPLGNGFPLEMAEGKKVFLIGGGIGIPPMLETARVLADKAQVESVLGWRDAETFLRAEFEPYGTVIAATEDGSVGTRGNVLDAIRENGLSADLIFACGPRPMLRALKEYAEKNSIPCYLSMEERMACGIGACLACVCETTDVDSHSHVKNRRVCKDGPVFEAGEVKL